MLISEIKPNPDNPRIITDESFSKLCKSIKDFPRMLELRPMVINDENIIIAGNMRHKALLHLKYKEIPDIWVKRAEEFTKEELREFMIKDNVEFGAWVWDDLEKEFSIEQLTDWGVDLPELLEVATPEAFENDITTAKKFLKPGDLLELNEHRLLCGSSLMKEDVERLMNGKKADIVFTDPPYDLEDTYTELIFEIAKKDCHIFILDSNKKIIARATKYYSYFKKIFVLDIIQPSFLVNNKIPMIGATLIGEFNKGKNKFRNLKDRFSTMIRSKVSHENFKNTGFTYAKLVELPETFLLHYSKPGDMAVDFFGGVGSTLIAAEKNNRVCYMMEFESAWCDVILKRWLDFMTRNQKEAVIKLNGNTLTVNKLLL